ncbi:hypothetical protein [Streptomyces sp. NPDC048639]
MSVRRQAKSGVLARMAAALGARIEATFSGDARFDRVRYERLRRGDR